MTFVVCVSGSGTRMDLQWMKVRVIAEIKRRIAGNGNTMKSYSLTCSFLSFSWVMIWWKMVLFVKIIVRDDHHEKFVT